VRELTRVRTSEKAPELLIAAQGPSRLTVDTTKISQSEESSGGSILAISS